MWETKSKGGSNVRRDCVVLKIPFNKISNAHFISGRHVAASAAGRIVPRLPPPPLLPLCVGNVVVYN